MIFWDKYIRTAQKSAQRFSSIFMFIVIFVLLKINENLAFATCLYHGGVFRHFISIGVYEQSLFYCSGSSKMHVEHPQTTLRFLGRFSFRQSASDSFPSLQLAYMKCVHGTGLKKNACTQRSTKCVHRMRNVTRSVFTELKHTHATQREECSQKYRTHARNVA